jgi:iron complex outermembrane receptor protein
VDNLTNRRYAGSVVVNDANLRFYEPAPGRNYTIGAQAKFGF